MNLHSSISKALQLYTILDYMYLYYIFAVQPASNVFKHIATYYVT